MGDFVISPLPRLLTKELCAAGPLCSTGVAPFQRYYGPRPVRCLRCLLLVMCTHPIAKEALTLHLARSEGHERYFGCNLMYRKVLVSSHQHLMAEAPKLRAEELLLTSLGATVLRK